MEMIVFTIARLYSKPPSSRNMFDKKVINVKTGAAIGKVSKEYIRKGKFV